MIHSKQFKMKNVFIILLSSLLITNVLAQEQKDTIVKKESKWSLGIYASPNYSYRRIYSDASFRQYDVYYRNKNDIPDYGYGISAELKYIINKKITITTGLNFDLLKYKTGLLDTAYAYPDPYDLSHSVTYYNILKQIYSHTFLSIPTIFNYTLIKRRVSYFIGFGGSFSYLLKSKKINYNTVENRKFDDAVEQSSNQFLFFGIIQSGVNYHINNNIIISLYPQFKYSNPLTIYYELKEQLYSFNINIGISFK